jgi:hypothetical protein
MAVVIGLGFGAYMALGDALLFRSVIPTMQTAAITDLSIVQRLGWFLPVALFDELFYPRRDPASRTAGVAGAREVGPRSVAMTARSASVGLCS